MQRTNLYYFGFYCHPDSSECSASFNATAHFIENLMIGGASGHRPLWERTNYQYFEYFPGYENVVVTLQVTYSSNYQVQSSLYLNSGACANKYEYVLSQNESSLATLHGQTTATYRLEVSTSDINIGLPVGLTVYTSASCFGETQCGYFNIFVYYSDDSASVPYYSDSQPLSSDYTSLPYVNTDSYEYNSDGTGLPSFSESYDYSTDYTSLPYINTHSYEYNSDGTGLPSFSESESYDYSTEDSSFPYINTHSFDNSDSYSTNNENTSDYQESTDESEDSQQESHSEISHSFSDSNVSEDSNIETGGSFNPPSILGSSGDNHDETSSSDKTKTAGSSSSFYICMYLLYFNRKVYLLIFFFFRDYCWWYFRN